MRRRKRLKTREVIKKFGISRISAEILGERIRKADIGSIIQWEGIPQIVKTEKERLAVLKNRSFIRKSPLFFQMELGKKMRDIEKELAVGETKTVRIESNNITFIKTKKGVRIVDKII